MKKPFLTICLFGTVFLAHAQSFLVPVESFLGSQPSILVTSKGDTLRGELKTALFLGGLLKSFSYELDGSKERMKFKAEDVRYLKIKASKLANLESMSAGASSLKRMHNTDFEQIRNREFIEFEQALQPGKKERYVLLQLLNPGFDRKIKVYFDPNGPKSGTMSVSGVAVTGGEDKSYLVIKNGAKAERIKKKDYEENFALLFGDCPELIKVYSSTGEKIRFADMASHIFDYDQACQ